MVPGRFMISTGTIPLEQKSVHWLSMGATSRNSLFAGAFQLAVFWEWSVTKEPVALWIALLGGAWDQAARQEVTSYRDSPCEQTDRCKTIPCPKLPLRTVIKPVSIAESVEVLDYESMAWVRNPVQFKSSLGVTFRSEISAHTGR